MRIDLHTHTKKCKSGDAPTRNVDPQEFRDILLSTDVEILAITNHNEFDLAQYETIIGLVDGAMQVWPGVELDVVETNGARGHLLVIVSPELATSFDAAVKKTTDGRSPDEFQIPIESIPGIFDSFQPLYIAHYQGKRPDISDDALNNLAGAVKRPACVLREVANAVSAGILISHGRPSIYGSDVQDWSKYAELSSSLPELRLRVDGFERFCLLLEKDPVAINTALQKKHPERYTICAFPDSTMIPIEAYPDINVIFGAKGTGKSEILTEIARRYRESGVASKVFRIDGAASLYDHFDIRCKNLNINLSHYGIDDCRDEIEELRLAAEVEITSPTRYVEHFSATNNNSNSKRILLKDLSLEDDGVPRRDYERYREAVEETSEFIEFLTSDSAVSEELTPVERDQVVTILSDLLERLGNKRWSHFSDWKQVVLLNHAINLFQYEVSRKIGIPAIPKKTGFLEYGLNRLKIEKAAKKVVAAIKTEIPPASLVAGSLGANKGTLHLTTELKLQDGTLRDASFSPLKGSTKTPQLRFAGFIHQVVAHLYTGALFEKLADLKSEEVKDVHSVSDLFLCRRYFSLGGNEYTPSGGESSMVMLQAELGEDKDVYILDEPEKSLGNEYISEVIVPLLKERAKEGKVIFIATHDANIAVRTLPYNTIYRMHDASGYRTYTGNPFINNLVNIRDASDVMEWKVISMTTLEGGVNAFGERGKIYGTN